MTKATYLGGFEQLVLLALAGFPDEADGMTIYDQIVAATNRDVSAPAVYVTLNRLEQKGLVRSRHHRSREARGKSRKYFRLLPAGVTALQNSRAALERLWSEVRAPGFGR